MKLNQSVFLLVFAFLLLLSASASANQVPDAEKGHVTAWSSSGARQWILGYSLNDLIGFSARYDRIEGTAGTREIFLPQLDLTLKTWKRPGSLTRVFFTLSYGAQKHPWGNSGIALADLEVVKETDRFYFGERFQFLRMVSHQPFNGMRFRGGIAPEALETPHLKTWVIVQMEKNGAISDRLVVTPLARIKTQSFFGEFGASLTGEWVMNLGASY